MSEKVRRQRRSSATMLGGLAVIVALTGVVAGGAQAADPGKSENAKACQKGGWEDRGRSEDYSRFANAGDCVSYAAQGGTLVNLLALCKQALADAGLSAPANANYIFGTLGDDELTDQSTAGNDVICGFSGDDKIEFRDDRNDVLEVGDIFLGGDGNDSLLELRGGTFEGGAGNDRLGSIWSGTFNGGEGRDSVGQMYGFAGTGGGTFNGGGGNDRVDMMYLGWFNGDSGIDSVDIYYCLPSMVNSVESLAECPY